VPFYLERLNTQLYLKIAIAGVFGPSESVQNTFAYLSYDKQKSSHLGLLFCLQQINKIQN
jgi:hypothetical protein